MTRRANCLQRTIFLYLPFSLFYTLTSLISSLSSLSLHSEMDPQMTKLILLYKFLGHYRAELNWQLCSDPDKKLQKTIKKRKLVYRTEQRISVLLERFRIALTEEELTELLTECDSQEISCRNSRETEIEIKHRPTCVVFNKEALHYLT